MSFLNSSTNTVVLTKLAPHLTKEHILSILHDNDRMIHINPIVKTCHRLPDASSIAFFKNEPASHQPSSTETPFPVYSVTEDMSGGSSEGGDSWRGGWTKHFIGDSLTYETSMQVKEDGLVSITHAPMGVHSMTTWVVKEENGGLILDERGVVTSNRMLMGFIRTTLQGSHDKLVKAFVALLEKDWAEKEVTGDDETIVKEEVHQVS